MPASTTTTSPRILQDRSSLSAPHEVIVKHLDWEIAVDFDNSRLTGRATYTIERLQPEATQLKLDTSHLFIEKVTGPKDDVPLKFEQHKSTKSYLGSQLVVFLDKDSSVNQVTIHYQTTKESSALQWLPPAQTVGRIHPYLFTQCQAIHARSLVPCQDRPGVKMTYSAKVTVPSWAVCVMSAVLQQETTLSEDKKCYEWHQAIPISSYLLAMAVGDLERRDISDRCAVWSEPGLADAALYEFGQTEDFLKIAEELAGKPYVWGRYDLLCLPPSFPYGGMENPCLTFLTPTLLAGDRSLADVVAHEIAHSWTGNLVTNATWDHFWLNEGWTTWFQRKIMARIHKDDRFLDFDALGGYIALRATVESNMPEDFTKLVLEIGDGDPDETYSRVAYEKGFNLLYALEKRVGKDKFEAFFQAYVKKYAKQILTSEDFRDFFMEYFAGNKAVVDFDWHTWLYVPGMPLEEPSFDRSLSAAAEKLAADWYKVDQEGGDLPDHDTSSWSSAMLTCFMDNLVSLAGSTPLKMSTVHDLHTTYNFGGTLNAEILFRYSMMAIAAEDESMIAVILHFTTSQGRMKYTRPLYRALFASRWRPVAVAAFLQKQSSYHPICAKMIANDLKASEPPSEAVSPLATSKKWLAWAAGGVALAVAAGFLLSKLPKR